MTCLKTNLERGRFGSRRAVPSKCLLPGEGRPFDEQGRGVVSEHGKAALSLELLP